ncbi:hypothetical protein ACFL54_02815 [Planctomycetota bacterium]
MNDQEIEELLKNNLRLKPARTTPPNTREADAWMNLAAPEASHRKLLVILALSAAAILLAVLGSWQLRSQTPPGSTPTPEFLQPISTVPENITPVRVIDIVKRRQQFQAILQDFRELRVASFQAGDSFGDFTVEAVLPKEVELKDNAGKQVILRPDSNHEAWQAFLDELFNSYQQRIDSRTMTGKDFENMTKLAYQGEGRLRECLEAIARDRGHYYHALAQGHLAGNQRSISHLDRLIRSAKAGNPTHRVLALKALAKTSSPLARKFLRDTLDDISDPLFTMVLNIIVAQHDVLALSKLQRLMKKKDLPPKSAAVIQDAIIKLSGE